MYLLIDPSGKSKPGSSLKLSKGHHQRIIGGSAKTFWGMAMSCQYDIFLGECDADGAKNRIRVFELTTLLLFVNLMFDVRHEVVSFKFPAQQLASLSHSYTLGSEYYVTLF